MRTLHVAAMPFPTQQGTQALVHTMLCALAETGHDSHLLCYGHGAFERETPYTVHRLRGWARGSLRSGPSPEKLVQDALLVPALRRLTARLEPEIVVAHHVEAALATLLARVHPVLFVAHTSLSAELRSYFPTSVSGLFDVAGRSLDRALCRGAERVVAVSPLLARQLMADSQVDVSPLQIPWPLPIVGERSLERGPARRALGLGDEDEVVLYAGNLDGYQGLRSLALGLSYLAQQRPGLRWLVATQSAPRELQTLLHGLGLTERVRVSPLASESDRRQVHAAADLAVVPRGSSGGLPIKLLDALGRGVPVVAVRRALAGLPFHEVCTAIADDDANAWQRALQQHFQACRGAAGAEAQRSYLRQTHASEHFVADFLRHAAACHVA